MSVSEHHVGQLYTVAKQSIDESTGSTAVEILINEPFEFSESMIDSSSCVSTVSSSHTNGANTSGSGSSVSAASNSNLSTSTSSSLTISSASSISHASSSYSNLKQLPSTPLSKKLIRSGQYTHKVYHVGGKLPGWLRALAPASMLKCTERAWNCYPYCRTIMLNEYLGERFHIIVETIHLDAAPQNPDALADESIDQDNVFQLTGDLMKQRQIYQLNIGKDGEKGEDYVEKYDPKKYVSKKTGRGPFVEGWANNPAIPKMHVYKLVIIRTAIFGVQTRAEKLILENQCKLFYRFYRRIACELDNWISLSMDDIRAIEEQTREFLDQKLDDFKLPSRTASDRPATK